CGAAIEGAIRGYAEEVRARTFPAAEHTYQMKTVDEPRRTVAAAAGPETVHADAPTQRATKKPKNPIT
ncbi:MAG: hypothetical protein ABL907_19795, partial [Hyphomicrobium sp.]